MVINKADHIAINTVDIEKSVAFYKEMLGFKELKRVPNGDSALVYMDCGCGTTLELFDWDGKCSPFSMSDDKSGLAHIAFDVSNIEEWNKKLIEKGAEFTLPLCTLEHLGKNVLLIKDPNSAVIELCEDAK